jgi:hypothetical protein
MKEKESGHTQSPPWAVLVVLSGGLWLPALGAADLPGFDFTQPQDLEGWVAQHDVGPLESTPQGMEVTLRGADPYFAGPPRDYPSDIPLWIEMRLWSEQGGSAQVFYFQTSSTEEASVRFVVREKRWEDVRVPLPALGPRMRLRIDPPGRGGRFLMERIGFSPRLTPASPAWQPPRVNLKRSESVELEAGILRLRQSTRRLGAFEAEVDGVVMAAGYPQAMVGYQTEGLTRWFSLADGRCSVRRHGEGLQLRWTAEDPDGGLWSWEQWWVVSGEGAIDQSTRLEVNVDREVVFVPAILMFPGQGSFGTNKHQALFAGVEYLANEPSSSEADVRGAAARRLVPDSLKLTMPLMALEQWGRYIALTWEPQPEWAAAFDSPDRQFGSGGHLMGLIGPGSDGEIRDEGSLLPYEGLCLRAGEALRLRATLIGGRGDSVVAAVRQYVAHHGWPELPEPGLTAEEYFTLAGHGWLDSKIRDGALFHHAWWPGFGAGPAGDAAMWMDWTAIALGDTDLADRLRGTAKSALAEVPGEKINAAAVGHVRYPSPALVYGQVGAGVRWSETQARSLLRQFSEPGVIRYVPRERGPDYASTHWVREANGLAGNVVARLLEAAAFSGSPELQAAAVEQLRAVLNRFQRTVPRGAQTWEIPLHTPDVLASAHLTKACVLGYQLTGDADLLDEAEYWAWTGVPFVYLVPPSDGAVGVYNTIAVLGATGWNAPVWFGQPVQWCGLVYADALRWLGRFRAEGPWIRLADGIAISGAQHTWRADDLERVGLLPDYFLLRAQRRDGPAINPATVQSQAIQAFGRSPVYDFVTTEPVRLQIHAAGKITVTSTEDRSVRFRVNGWYEPASWVLVHRCPELSEVSVNGEDIESARFDVGSGRLAFPVPSKADVELRFSESLRTRSP